MLPRQANIHKIFQNTVHLFFSLALFFRRDQVMFCVDITDDSDLTEKGNIRIETLNFLKDLYLGFFQTFDGSVK